MHLLHVFWDVFDILQDISMCDDSPPLFHREHKKNRSIGPPIKHILLYSLFNNSLQTKNCVEGMTYKFKIKTNISILFLVSLLASFVCAYFT